MNQKLSTLAKFLSLLTMATVLASRAAADPPPPKTITPYGHDYFTLRGGLENCRIRFEHDKVGRVAFMGGSITEGGGWRDLVCKDLRTRFPNTKFDFINAGIGSTGSTPGAFDLTRDVFSRGPVDLLFEEAAVNDDTDAYSDVAQARGMEGIVRHAREINPAIDIVLLHFVDPGKIEQINRGQTPAVIANHEKVAEHYAVPSIDLAREVTERIRAGEFTWAKDFRDLHPSPFGHALYARSVGRLFDAAWKEPIAIGATQKSHPVPAEPLDRKSYFRGRLGKIDDAQRINGWTIDPAFKPHDGAATRKGFVDVPMLVANEPGAALKLKFHGTAIGLFVAAGPDAGVVEYSIDGRPSASQDLFTRWSGGLHIPWAFVLNGDLTDGDHELTLRIANKQNPASKGHACRIVNFLLN